MVRLTAAWAILALCPSVAAPQSATGPSLAKLVKDETVVLKFPWSFVTSQERRKLGMYAGSDEVVKVTADSEGRAIVGGDADWRTAGFPSLLEMKVNKLKLGSPVSEVELKFASPKLALKVKVLITGDAQKLFPQIVSRQEDATTYRDEAYAGLVAKFFTGPLASMAEDKKYALLTFANVNQGRTIGSTTYEDRLYLEIDLGSDINVYDDRQLNQGQRINHVMNDKLLTILRAFAEPVRKLTTIYGLKLDFGIPHKNFSEDSTGPDVLDKRVFLEESEGPDVDKLEVYASAELIRHFAEADITSQQLLDGSVVIVNSNRIQVALSGS